MSEPLSVSATDTRCGIPTDHVFAWPGQAEKPICLECSHRALVIAMHCGGDITFRQVFGGPGTCAQFIPAAAAAKRDLVREQVTQ